jgi:DNA-binding MarR family transcriptional regulator
LTVKLLENQAVTLWVMTDRKRQAKTRPARKDDNDGIGRLTRELVRAVDHYRQWHAENTGTGVTELLALGHLYHDGDLSPTQLAQQLDLTTGSVTALVNRLVAAGYAERHPHSDDRRRLVITLTRSGTKVISSLFVGLRDAAAAALDGASPSQRRVVAGFLESTTTRLVETIQDD